MLFRVPNLSVAKTMTRLLTLDTSPPKVRIMADSLDVNAFRKSIPILAVRIPAVKTALVLKSASMKRFSRIRLYSYLEVMMKLLRFLLDLPKFRSVVRDSSDSDGDRLVLLRVSDEGTSQLVELV
jgi:tRNA (guanine37-N1)-methyltransferase